MFAHIYLSIYLSTTIAIGFSWILKTYLSIYPTRGNWFSKKFCNPMHTWFYLDLQVPTNYNDVDLFGHTFKDKTLVRAQRRFWKHETNTSGNSRWKYHNPTHPALLNAGEASHESQHEMPTNFLKRRGVGVWLRSSSKRAWLRVTQSHPSSFTYWFRHIRQREICPPTWIGDAKVLLTFQTS